MRIHPAGTATSGAPSSPCTPACLGTAPAAGRLHVAVRLAGLVVVLLGAVLGTPLLGGRARLRWRRACARGALRAAGVRLRVVGGPGLAAAGGGTLVVANHLSWIDVLALDAVQPVRMLAKREVRDWPVIGGLARRHGALFVDRSGLRTLPATVAATACALRRGAVVGVFPEGTTWCGAAAGPFRRAVFQAAIDADVAVRPVAMSMRLPDGTPARDGAFVGDQSLWDSVRRVLALPCVVCEVVLLPPRQARAVGDRRELARWAGAAVAAATGVPHGPAAVTPAATSTAVPGPAPRAA